MSDLLGTGHRGKGRSRPVAAHEFILEPLPEPPITCAFRLTLTDLTSLAPRSLMIACPPHNEDGENVKRKLRNHGLRLLAGISLIIFGWGGAHAQEARTVRADASGKPPYNIVFLI